MIEPLSAALIERLTILATAESLLICSDFDGTLSPLVLRPCDAEFLPGIKSLLHELSALNSTNIAIISGRARSDLVSLTGLDTPIALVGSHGAELPSETNLVITYQQTLLLKELQSSLIAMLSDLDGVSLEYKPYGVTVHVRQASRGLADHVTKNLLAGPCQRSDVYCQLGKEVIELSVVPMNKGSAIERLRLRSRDRTRILYLGDDITDEQAFNALFPLDMGVKVGAGSTRAEFRVDSPVEIRSLLGLLIRLRSCYHNPP